MRSIIISAVFILTGCVSTGATSPRYDNGHDEKSISVMVLGTYHFSGANADVLKVDIENVLSTSKQAELRAIADAMAAFNPNVVVTERVTKAPDYIDPYFASFNDDVLTKKSNEREQLGFRIARTAGVQRVYGIDEQTSDGEPQYFPFGKLTDHVAATGQKSIFDAEFAAMQQEVSDAAAQHKGKPIAEVLIEYNSGLIASPQLYYALGKYDVGEDQPAAELQSYWFMRNAKIFSKIIDVTEPGDRVIIVYGSGHKFWLEHFAEQTEGFHVVDPIPYLELAAEK